MLDGRQIALAQVNSHFMVQIFSQYVSRKTLLLTFLETCLITLAVIAGAKLRFWNDPSEFSAYCQFPDFLVQVLALVLALQLSFYYGNLYNRRAIGGRYEEAVSVAQSLGAASVLLGLLYWLWPALLIGRGVFFLSLALIAILVLTSRVLLDRAWRFAVPTENVLILGTHHLGLTVAHELRQRSDLNLKLAGFVNSLHERVGAPDIEGVPVLGEIEDLERIASEHKISRIVVAMEERRGGLPTRELVTLRVSGIHVEDAHSIISSLSGRVWLATIRPSWFVFSNGFHRSKLTVVLKRLMDLLISCMMVILTAPLLALTALAIRLDSKGPVIYRQARVGLRGHPFDVLKFRSMRTDAEALNGAQWAVLEDPRITRVGRFIRKYRLDELPQLVNVLQGEMSFVGPRPERPCFVEELRKHIPFYDERHSVRPGITGWAQVQYSYSDSILGSQRKLEYDLFYLKNLSIFFDCAIILKTAQIVLTGSGSR
jgi:sugar transferase (PEP-CTERM system associated)